ncbi:MAG: Unknown protein [uncultured Sulfurovum sp.]|uniref:CBS domain-containing protein n=1 Tax=uncultured Sulfurovum sp. TaxID=269237 RepID=A0A6S6TUS7_9BACT|nr:MAG: Unknown protein [uncultured Sulfurovum sp.]
MLVKSIMTPVEQIAKTSPMATVRGALTLMKEHKVRSVVVDKNGDSGAYGLLTFRNVLQSIISEDGDIDLLNVYDIATLPAVSVSASLEVKYAAKMMVNSNMKRLLVLDNNQLVGIVTMSDIIEVLMENVEEL